MTLSVGDLESARSEAEKYLPERVAIHRDVDPDADRDPGGGVVDEAAFPVVAGLEDVPARLENRKQATYEEGGSIRVREIAVLKLPAGTDVRETDHVVIGGKTWNVVGVERREWEIYRVSNLEEIS